MDFMIGCNYWASHAGTEMWAQWDEKQVRADFKLLSEHGVEYMRVFPNWRDFQPVKPMYAGGGNLFEYRLEGDRFPTNPEFLDDVMLERFDIFCDIAEEYGIKLIVGLLTGWMSGRLFIPQALNGLNLLTHPTAILFEQRLIRGMVSRFKHKKAIYAWDLGNECNCMSPTYTQEEASSWTGIIANAIKANDPTRPVVSGLHGCKSGEHYQRWPARGQGEFCDILTTHPYAVWCENVYRDNYTSYRTLIHPACETKFYAALSGRPCLVEEIGTMGPMMCDDKTSADFMRLQLFSNWANGGTGVLWWCGHDQNLLETAPYTWQMCEIELGMTYNDNTPKPVLKETKRVRSILEGFDFTLPAAKDDAVCILTRDQDSWSAAFATYALAKQAGLNITFADNEAPIPESDCYLLPSVEGVAVMPREKYLELRKRVYEGATLYVSVDGGHFADIEPFFGFNVVNSSEPRDSGTISIEGEDVAFWRKRRYELAGTTAEILAFDESGNPAFTVNKYGKGKVYFVNFPAETMLLSVNNCFDKNTYLLYKKVFAEKIATHEAICDNQYIGMTLHPADDGIYCVLVNYSPEARKTGFAVQNGYKVDKVIYGNTDEVAPLDACVVKLVK